MEQITAAAVGFDPDNLSHEINKLINWVRSTYTDRDATVNSITPLGKAKGEDLKVLVLFDLIPKPPPAVYATPGGTFTFNDDPDKAFWKPSARIEALEIEVQTQKDFANGLHARLEALESDLDDESQGVLNHGERISLLEAKAKIATDAIRDLLNPIDATTHQVAYHSEQIHQLKGQLSNTNIGLQELRNLVNTVYSSLAEHLEKHTDLRDEIEGLKGQLSNAEQLIQEFNNSPRYLP